MRIAPASAAVVAALATAPAAAMAAASIPDLADQALAWIVTAIVTAVASAIVGVVAKLTGAKLDQQARDTSQVALTNAANAAIRWMLTAAAETPIGKRIELAIEQMLPYVETGAAGAVKRFDMAAKGANRIHLEEMAAAKLVEQLGHAAPDDLKAVIRAIGA
ncbi:hypothetical protein [Paracoccus benzoatiresistens]|uniref:Holin n=1 Tax=Paracoccus benzoatiresistens TaxID=2997341 RepID=A0ABT4J9V2_9RHOB|nr:hypothetical protein [Paracoccus sp. EF6]MCZ0963907.1 hypothetical protein [Paracoccus sp. EF6]